MLTNESKLLIKYIETKVKKTPLFKEYRELYDFFDSVNYQIKILSSNEKLNKEYSSLNVDSTFISEDISEELYLLNKTKQVIFKTNISTITINIYYSDENIKQFLTTVIKAIGFIFNIAPHNVEKCTINYYLSEKIKKLHENKDYSIEEFSKKEVNSGSCSTNTINIWRKEEILKVTFHECIHLLNFDFKSEDFLLKEIYKKKYKITSTSMNIFEAYTEIWAELINIFFFFKVIKKKKHKFAKYIEYEKFFSNYQASKIFYIKSLNDIPNDLNKYTNVLPYYIIKCEIFNNLKDFLNYCKKNNMNYVKLKEDLKNFLEGLCECKKNNKLFTKIDKKSYKYTTMRMSSIELNLFNECKHLPC